MNAALALSSLTTTYHYLKYVLGETRPSENFTLQAYIKRAKPVFEKIAKKYGYAVFWGEPSGYVKDAGTNGAESRLRDNYTMRSDSVLEFTLIHQESGDEKTALLFIENSIIGHSLTCRLLNATEFFEHRSIRSLDFLMKPPHWPAHQTVLRKAAEVLFSDEALSKMRARYALSKAA